jgi:hypothetical protein
MHSACSEQPVPYANLRCEADAGWNHKPVEAPWSSVRRRSRLVEPREVRFSLDEVLKELRGPDFAARLSTLRVRREARLFSADLSVRKLIHCLEYDATTARPVIESFLDRVFEDLREGEDFEHTEVVMGMLFALKAAESSLFREVAEVLSGSRAAELGRLSDYARRLLTE